MPLGRPQPSRVVDIAPMDGPPYAEQLLILQGTDSVVCEGGTKTGKTVAAMAWQMLEVINGPGPGAGFRGKVMTGRHAWFAQAYRVAKISYDRAVIRLRPLIDAGLLDAVETPYPLIRGKGKWRGREWHFLSTEKVSNIYGEEWQSIVVEEFTRHRTGAIDAIMTTAKPLRARVVMIGNVKDRLNDGWHRARLCEAGGMGEGWRYLRITCWDAAQAGVVERAELEAERDRLAALGKLAQFRRDYECVLDESDRPFPSDVLLLAQSTAPPAARHRVLHLDAGGVRNPAGLVIVAHSASGRHIEHAEHWLGTLTDLHAHVLDLDRRHGFVAVTFDSYGGKLCEDLANHFGRRAIKCTAADSALRASFERLRGDLNDGSLTMAPGLDVLVRDLQAMELDIDLPVATTYPWEFDGADHPVHCDAAVALLQGYLPALAHLQAPAGSGTVGVHGAGPARTHGERAHRWGASIR